LDGYDRAKHSSITDQYRTNEAESVHDTLRDVGGKARAVDKNYRRCANHVLTINIVPNVFHGLVFAKLVDRWQIACTIHDLWSVKGEK